MRKSVPRDRGRLDTAHVTDVASAIRGRVGVENLAIESRTRHADAVTATYHRRKITDAYDAAASTRRYAHESNQVAVGVVGLEPSKARGVGVSLPQRRFVAVDAIEIAHEHLQFAMVGIFEQVPVDARIVIPFVPLPEFLPHENHLLARSRPHVREQRALIGKLLQAI